MPNASVKLIPGVNAYETSALNEAAVSTCNLIRYTPDPKGLGLVEKLGGWARFYPNAMPATVRALWAWQALDGHAILGIGMETQVSATAGLMLIHQNTELVDITPHQQIDNISAAVTSIAGSNQFSIHDVGSNINNLCGVYIPAHISIASCVIFGLYQCIAGDADDFSIQLYDLNNNPISALTSTTGGVVAQYTTTNGSASVNVNLPSHNYSAGATYPIMIQTSVGGCILAGNYTVQSVTDSANFTILAPQNATTAATVAINGGLARYDFLRCSGPLPAGTGWGSGGWGSGGWGSGVAPVDSAGTNLIQNDWSLDNWGEALIASPDKTLFASIDGTTTNGGPLYYWSHEGNTFNAQPICGLNAPVYNTGFFIAMPQRQIVAYGSTSIGVQDPLLVKWCNIGDFLSQTAWLPTPTNLAGSFRLSRGSRIVGGGQVGQQGLLWTDVGLWTMTFIGSSGGTNSAYGFNEVGRDCGLLAKHAWGVLGGVVYWVGAPQPPSSANPTGVKGQIYTLSSEGVAPVRCPVLDTLFQNLDPNNTRKVVMGVNAAFNEIRIEYPSLNGNGENDSYIKFNALIGAPNGWDSGYDDGTNVSRTAWVGQSPLGQPIGAGATSPVLYQHEVSYDADNQAMMPFFQTGFFALNETEFLAFVDMFIPDFKWGQVGQTTKNAQVQVTFFVQEYPGSSTRTYGPYTLSQAVQFITPRFRGKLVALQFQSSDVGSWWRLGVNRYRYQPAGKFL